MTDRFLPGVPGDAIERLINAAPGNEIQRGKFDNPASSAALAANALGFFLQRAPELPPLPGCAYLKWPANWLSLEQEVRFPWAGGRHPILDALITTRSALIGVESKRFEPFRPPKRPTLSDAYWRPLWGDRMQGYARVRDQLRAGRSYAHLDAAQLFKHAFALRTAVQPGKPYPGRAAILFYLYAEPQCWPDGRPVDAHAIAGHRKEIARFAAEVDGSEVTFIACAYRTLLADWQQHRSPAIRQHAAGVIDRFAP